MSEEIKHKEFVNKSRFFMVCYGEVYFTEEVSGPNLVERIMEATSGEEWDPKDIEFWNQQIYGPDNWSGNGEANMYSADIGETDHIELFLISPNN